MHPSWSQLLTEQVIIAVSPGSPNWNSCLLSVSAGKRSWGSSVNIESRLWTGRPGFDSPQGQWCDYFLFTTASRPAVGRTQPSIQWDRTVFPSGWRGRSVKLSTHLDLMPRLRMRGAIPPLPQYVFMAWCLVKHRNNFTSAGEYRDRTLK
jgi:hypothetical protein